MTDPMSKLEEAMRAAPAPRGAAKAMDAAMRAFDEEFEAGSQETPAPARQTSQTQPVWEKMMTYLSNNLRPALMGGASVAALSLALFVTVQQGHSPLAVDPVADLETAALAPEGDDAAAVGGAQKSALTEQRAESDGGASTSALMEQEEFAVAAAPAPARERLLATAPAVSMKREASPRTGAAMDLGIMPMPEPSYVEPTSSDRFANDEANPVKLVSEAPVSTFSVDVDTASYAWVRRSLLAGALPAPEAVRVEELINYFPYDYAAPESAEAPFAVSTTLMNAPWAEGRQLLHIGIRGYEPPVRLRANFTFLIDTSGSMQSADKLPLLVTSFRLLLSSLDEDDTVAIVTYAGAAGVALEPTPVRDRATILTALDRLSAGGSTAGAAGIETAYRLAEERFDAEAVNRVILATDGDFNVGAASVEAMETLIGEKRDSGVYLSVLGFGRGNLNDALMQSLAQAGNGQAAYIDTLSEARKALVDEVQTLTPIAEDVKIQIEFNPAAVQDYRLIGYETRALAREDFNNDRVDAGEIGAGHRVTAIYEVTPVGGPARIDPSRYQPVATGGDLSELAFLRLRHKAPQGDQSELTEIAIPNEARSPGAEAGFAVAVAGFGELLRKSPHLGDWSWPEAMALASANKAEDRFGYRAEFLDLLRLAEALDQ